MGNPSTVTSTAVEVVMASTLTAGVIGTLLVARKREGVFRRQTLALKYGVFRKAYYNWLSLYVPCVLSISVHPLSVHGGRIPCLLVVHFPGWGVFNNM